MARRRQKLPPLVTVDDQRRWLADWMSPSGTTGTSRADRAARQLARKVERTIGPEEVDLVVLEAVERTRSRVEKKLAAVGAIDPVGQGFPAYCRVVLHNEVRRQLARRTRRHARQLQPEEALTVRLAADDNPLPVPLHTVGGIVLGVNAWCHKWHNGRTERLEAARGEGVFEVATALEQKRLFVAGRDARTPLQPLLMRFRDVELLRAKNHGVEALHVRIDLIGYEAEGETVEPARPRPLVNTQRGIGQATSTLLSSGLGRGGGAPWEHVQSGRGPGNPRNLPAREFTPCEFGAGEASHQVEAMLGLLGGTASGDPSGAWLTAGNARAAALEAVSLASLTASTDDGRLLCRLAEWAEPGLHAPHRSGHAGRHPLHDEIRIAVEKLQRRHPRDRTVTENALSQARSRLVRLAQETVAEIARVVHR